MKDEELQEIVEKNNTKFIFKASFDKANRTIKFLKLMKSKYLKMKILLQNQQQEVVFILVM